VNIKNRNHKLKISHGEHGICHSQKCRATTCVKSRRIVQRPIVDPSAPSARLHNLQQGSHVCAESAICGRFEGQVLALKGLGGSRDRKEQDGPTRTLSVCIGSTVLIDKPL